MKRRKYLKIVIAAIFPTIFLAHFIWFEFFQNCRKPNLLDRLYLARLPVKVPSGFCDADPPEDIVLPLILFFLLLVLDYLMTLIMFSKKPSKYVKALKYPAALFLVASFVFAYYLLYYFFY